MAEPRRLASALTYDKPRGCYGVLPPGGGVKVRPLPTEALRRFNFLTIRDRPVNCRQVHGQASAGVGPNLEDLSAQSCGGHWRDGLPRRSDDWLSAVIRAGHPEARAPTPSLGRRHRPSDRG